MWSLFRILMDVSLLKPIMRPITRMLVGFIAVPLFRAFTRKVLRVQTLDKELEKDLEQWFRGAILLLFATQNMESMLFPWVKPILQERLAKYSELRRLEAGDQNQSPLEVDHQGDAGWVFLGLRVMLAIGVVQMMPDQELFAVIHHGPPKLKWEKGQKIWLQIRAQTWPFFKGHLCVHLNRSSPVFAIMAAIAPGTPGWTCYAMALIQYLIIGLVTSRDKAMNVLQIFDETVQRRREELLEEFALPAAPPREVAAAQPTPETRVTAKVGESELQPASAREIPPASSVRPAELPSAPIEKDECSPDR